MAEKKDQHLAALGAVREIRSIRRGCELAFEGELARFEFIQADVLRIRISQGGLFDATPTFAVVRDEFGPVEFKTRKTARQLTLTSDAMKVNIHLASFHFDVFRRDGSSVLRPAPGQCYQYLNDDWKVVRRGAAGDAYLGLGEKTGPMNRNGRKLQMWNTDILAPNTEGLAGDFDAGTPQRDPRSDIFDPYYMSINLYYHLPAGRSDLAAASYIDNGYRLRYDLSSKKRLEIRGDGGQYTEYVFAGPSIKQILTRFTELTGRMQPPPIWALGHHQCRWKDYSQKQWIALGEAYRRKQIPCDTLWLDIGYMDGFRVFTWNEKLFPDPQAAIAKLRQQGFRAITIVDPGVKHESGYRVFDQGKDRNLFCKTESGQTYIGQVWPGRTAFPDFVKEETRQWWGRLNADHVRSGLAGIWNDMNEPATGSVPASPMRFDRDGVNHPHERYHNQYGMLMAMGTYEGLRQSLPDQRPLILSRAGFAGIQRYAANWTGDNHALWEHLAMSIPMNCGLGLSGQPFVGSDIGGFAGDTHEELLIRWYQYGTFQPFMRNHSCINLRDQYPWSFGRKSEKLIREAIELRYRLLPYIYTAFMRSAKTGEPIQRPLVWDFQDDPAARDNSTEYLFGPHLLVAPVIRKGDRARELYLPKGDWYCFHTGRRYRGPGRLTVDAPLSRCPVLVRAGAVIPTAPLVQTTAEYAPTELTLNVYLPDRNGTTFSELYEDDGLSFAWESGQFLHTEMQLSRRGQSVRLIGRCAGNGYPGFARKRFRLNVIGGTSRPRRVKNTGEDFELDIP